MSFTVAENERIKKQESVMNNFIVAAGHHTRLSAAAQSGTRLDYIYSMQFALIMRFFGFT